MATEGDDLDAFMENLHGKDTKLDKTEIRKLRVIIFYHSKINDDFLKISFI